MVFFQVGEILKSLEIQYTESGSFVENVGEECEDSSNREPDDGSKESEKENQVPPTVIVKTEPLTSEETLCLTEADHQLSERNYNLLKKEKRKSSQSRGIRRSQRLRQNVLSLEDNNPHIQSASSDSEKHIKQSCPKFCEVKGDILRPENCEVETFADEAQEHLIASEDMKECINSILEASLNDLSRNVASTSEEMDQECGGRAENTAHFVADEAIGMKADNSLELSIRCNRCDSDFPLEEFTTKHRVHADGFSSVQISSENKGETSPSSSTKSGLVSKSVRKGKQAHTGNKNVCDKCGKAFSRPSKVRRHEVIHTGEKPFKCGSCGKSFSQSNNRDRHLLLHNARLCAVGQLTDRQRQLACDLCGKFFSCTTAKNKHFRIVHMRLRPFECDLCLKKFGQNHHLRRHKLLVHKIKFD